MVYLCGLYFALRSGQELCNLHFNQTELTEPPNTPAYLVYHNISKSNYHGAAHQKVQSKRVGCHSNTSNPFQSFVQLFKQHCQHCMSKKIHNKYKTTAFYKTPPKKSKQSIWYAQMCWTQQSVTDRKVLVYKAGGISGFKTNHR